MVDTPEIRNPRGRRPHLNPFGEELYRLMEKRGIHTSQELANLLQSKGYDYSRQSISDYASGKTRPRGKFLNAVLDVLDLSRDEDVELARIYAYGQG